MFKNSLVTLFIAATAFAFAGYGHAQSIPLTKDFDEWAKPWEEAALVLPPDPQKENLLEFYVSETATQTFAIDARSLSVGKDAVVRYTLVSRSQMGAENISYEGIRCETYEKKVYAYGQKDGGWSRSRNSRWQLITGSIANRYHAALARDYFCSHKVVEGKAEDIIARLRNKQAFTARLTQ